MNDAGNTGKTARHTPKKGKRGNGNKGRKQSAETIAKRIATMKANREAKKTQRQSADVAGAIISLRRASRLILERVRADHSIKDFSEVELEVFNALRDLQGTRKR